MGNLSYLELVFQCAELYFKSLSFFSLSNITQNYGDSDSQGIQRQCLFNSYLIKYFSWVYNQLLGSRFPWTSFSPKDVEYVTFRHIDEIYKKT